MRNIKLVIKPDETITDLINELCEEANVGEDDIFCFSAIVDKQNNLKINIQTEQNQNIYTPRDVANFFCKNMQPNKITYLQPPLEQWLISFKPLLLSMVEKIYPTYQKLLSKEEILSSAYEIVVVLYNKGYYLHNTIVYKSLINNLNMQIRKTKHFQDQMSFEQPLTINETNEKITLADVISDPNSTIERIEEQEYEQFLFNMIKEEMLKEISSLSFDRILLQLEHKCVDTQTSKLLRKYRQKFAPNNIPRPNAFGKPKHKNEENNK